jgi:PhnB protein
MDKRSLGPGRNEGTAAERLNRAVDAMLARNDGSKGKLEGEIEGLLRIAADLRDLPAQGFKARLKSELMKSEITKSELRGEETMTTVAEPVAAVSTTATPRITFKDAGKAIEFYTRAFGAVEKSRFEVGGDIPHAEIVIGSSTLFLTEEWPEGGRFSAETLGSSPVLLSLQVDDVDSFADHAVAAGLKTILPIKNQFYGRREGTYLDPFGYTWSISTVTEELSVEEMHRRMKGLTTGPEGGALRAEQGNKPTVNPVPRGFHTVTPYLVAADGGALLDFAERAFGAEDTQRIVGPVGGMHGETRIGDTRVMMGGGVPGREFAGKFMKAALHVYVKDTDATYRKALEAGATSIGEPKDMEYGERGASVKDPFGNFWYIATAFGEDPVPKGVNSVNAYMHPLRAQPVIDFLKRAFGGQEVAKYASPDGVVHHAQVRVGDAVIEMGEANGPYQPMEPMFYVYVPDCGASYRRALAAGATSKQEPTDQPYGDRNAAVTDPFGNTWYVATHVKDVS